MKITRVSRGVQDPQACASFLSRLFELSTEEGPEGIQVICSNGSVLFHDVASQPVAIGLQTDRPVPASEDPDGVPIFDDTACAFSSVSVKIDHVRLNCANLASTVAFYRELGFRLTWAGHGDETLCSGYDEEWIPGADWVHLSSRDGYLSLAQADWLPFGAGLPAAGPPRFLHVGFAVPDIIPVENRLNAARTGYIRPESSPLGRQVYLNDPSGDAAVGNNVEIYCYQADSWRSGAWEEGLPKRPDNNALQADRPSAGG